MAFFTAFTRCVTVGKGISNSAIHGYVLNINKVNTRLSRLVVLLKALNAICKTAFLLILGSLCYGTVTDLVQGLSLRAWHMYIDVSFLPPPSSSQLDIRVHRQSNRTGVRSLLYTVDRKSVV